LLPRFARFRATANIPSMLARSTGDAAVLDSTDAQAHPPPLWPPPPPPWNPPPPPKLDCPRDEKLLAWPP